jgi:hypothetical protein
MVESLLLSLGELLEKTNAEKGVKQKVPAPDSTLLAKLLDAASRYKTTLMEDILENIESYDYESGGDLVIWLREQMENLEYDAICRRLEDLTAGK